MWIRSVFLPCAGLALALSACRSTSLSDPSGRGHGHDLSLYELTGQAGGDNVTEAQIASARRAGGRTGSLPPRGAKVLLVQSGAHQPDDELISAYRPYCQPVIWDGRAPGGNEERKTSGGAVGRKLRLVAAEQGCSHVIVIFGEIQSDSHALPTKAVTWVPVVGHIVPSERSGTRLVAQALILETGSGRYLTVAARTQQTSGVTTEEGAYGVDSRRSLRLKAKAYPDLAAQSFRG